MRTRILLPILFSCGALLGIFFFLSQSVHALETEGWQTVAPGIEYQKFYFPVSNPDNLGPNYVYVARMDRANPTVTIDSMISNGNLANTTQRTSNMAAGYEQTLNFWGQTWGNRTDVVAAINGYYFGEPIEPPGVPWRGQINSGWYAKRFDDNENGSGFVWKLDRTAFIGECVYHQPSEQIVSFAGTTTSTVKIDDINAPRGEDQLILFTPQYDSHTMTDDGGVEILVEMTRPTLILPPSLNLLPTGLPQAFESWLNPDLPPRNPESEAIGYVRAIRNGQGDTLIPFDHIVLSATGIKRDKLLENLEVGEEIGISQAVNHLSDEDCETPITGKDWTKAYAAIGGGFYFLRDSVINGYYDDGQATAHTARTAIAYSPDYVFFIVVDAFEYPYNSGNTISKGMNMGELGYFARETLGATYGISQDSGGSSTMVINGQVVNTPSHNPQSIVPVACTPINSLNFGLSPASYLPLINNQIATPSITPTPTQTPTATPTATPPPGLCYQGDQRYVANGMMMVVVEPISTTTTFTPTQSVVTTQDANLRTGPGTNYPVINTIAAGDNGTVLPHMNGLNGVLATGFHWWYVDFGGGNVGWISETVLAGGGG